MLFQISHFKALCQENNLPIPIVGELQAFKVSTNINLGCL